jgi:hypothetical protein
VKPASLWCGLLLLGSSARAQDAIAEATLPPAPEEFIALFQTYCLEKFPDDDVLAAAAQDKKLRTLTSAEIRLFLRGDPGQGWLIEGESGKYILTDELPPIHACAIRHAVRSPFSAASVTQAAEKFVAAKGHHLVAGPSLQSPLGGGITTSLSSQSEVTESGIPTGEAFLFAVVTYPAQMQADGSQSTPFWEVRFVRQITRKPV